MNRAWVSTYGGFPNGISWFRINGWPHGIGLWRQGLRVRVLWPSKEYGYGRCPVYALQGA